MVDPLWSRKPLAFGGAAEFDDLMGLCYDEFLLHSVEFNTIAMGWIVSFKCILHYLFQMLFEIRAVTLLEK